MNDANFELLKVQAAIAPQSAEWPKADYSKASISGAKPTLGGADAPLHWNLLHGFVDQTRDAVLKACGSLSAADEDKRLSAAGRAERKKEIAEAAIAELNKSTALDRARAAVESQVARWNDELGVAPKPPTDFGNAMIHTELRTCVAAQKAEERMLFVTKHLADVAPAILSAPPVLSGLSKAEYDVVRHSLEMRTNPEIASQKQTAIQALAHAEAGLRNGIRTIRERAGIADAIGNGGAQVT